jgi:hypothetical protein
MKAPFRTFRKLRAGVSRLAPWQPMARRHDTAAVSCSSTGLALLESPNCL